MSDARSRTSLTRFANGMQEPDSDRAWQETREAWHTHGIVCISLKEAETRLGWSTARQLRTIGEQAFGKRGAR